jgi:hypothetical protein
MNVRYLIIILAADKVAINTVAKAELDTKRGERTFSIGLSATGKAPVTHYWCSSVFSDAKTANVLALKDQFPNSDVLAYDADKDPKFPGRLIATLGLKQLSNFPEKPWL